MRIVINGCSGSGKTTLARAIAARCGIARLQLDAEHWLPEWEERPDDEFKARVAAFLREHEAWVIDGNYHRVLQDLVWPEATMVVALDLPRWRVMSQIIWRSGRRVLTREELYSGNTEGWRGLTSSDPEENIVLWAWIKHAYYRELFARNEADHRWRHIHFERLKGRGQVDRWLEGFVDDWESGRRQVHLGL